jgi:DHA2 family multidrug resistance protein
MTGTDANTQDTRTAVTTRPLLGVAGVLLGALIATCTSRFLGSVRGFLPLQEAPVMAWVALPQFLLGVAAMALMRKIDPRLILVGVACLLDARVTSVWAGPNFGISQAVMAVGLALVFNSMVGAGSEMGSTFIGHFIAVREEFHSNRLGLNIQLGNSLTNSKLFALQHAFAPHSTGLTAMGRAAEVLGLEIRQQAYTLTISKSFLLLATCCVACLVVVSFMSKVPTQYRQVTAAPVEAK